MLARGWLLACHQNRGQAEVRRPKVCDGCQSYWLSPAARVFGKAQILFDQPAALLHAKGGARCVLWRVQDVVQQPVHGGGRDMRARVRGAVVDENVTVLKRHPPE